jgi:hypothetical protein
VVWDFFTFPVFFAAAGGALLACIVAIVFPILFYVMFLVALMCFSFALAHFIFTGSRKRGIQRRMRQAEEDEIERRVLAERSALDAAGQTSKRSRRRRRVI